MWCYQISMILAFVATRIWQNLSDWIGVGRHKSSMVKVFCSDHPLAPLTQAWCILRLVVAPPQKFEHMFSGCYGCVIYPRVSVYISMVHRYITIFNWNAHYFYGHFQSLVTNYQRVSVSIFADYRLFHIALENAAFQDLSDDFTIICRTHMEIC